jgi:LytS/YehU family sensor histidine kinase
VIILFVFITISIAQLRIKSIKKKERNKRQMLTTMNDLELQAFHYSMNPHFLFNSLNSIQQFITKYRDAVAVNFISEFSLLVRNNLEALRSGWISLDNEIEQLERYLSLESHRLNHALSYKIEVDPSIPLSQVEVPPLFIQPFIENSIWHGIAPKENKEGSFIRLQIEAENEECLRITIQDNGVGLNAQKNNKKPGHVSRGIELIRKRLELLSEKNQFEILETKDREGNPTGTLVSIIFHIVD